MESNNLHIDYTAADLLAYARGQMTAQQMHALEKAALEDDFLAEALEGYMMENTKTQIIDPQFLIIPNTEGNQDMIAQKLASFKEKINAGQKDEENLPKVIPIWRQKWVQYAVAASIVLGGLWLGISYKNGENKASNTPITVAQNEPVIIKNEPSNITADTISVQSNSNNQKDGTRYLNVEKPDISEQKLAQGTISASPGIIAEDGAKSDSTTFYLPKENEVIAFKDIQADSKQASIPTKAKLATPMMNSMEKKFDSSPNYGPSENMMNNRSQNNYDKFANAKRYSFQGRVVDANNNPLPYSSIVIPGEDVGTYSDAKGNFNFIYVDSVLPVRARSLGFAAQNFKMQPDIKENKIVLKEDEDLKNKIVFSKMERQAKSTAYKSTIVETDTLYSAEPVVGWNDYYVYSANNNRITDIPSNLQSVQLSFEVDKYGEVQNITVEKSLGKDADAEAIRLLKEGPKWKPKNGSKGKAKVTVKF